jgi:hypothetical protein
METEEQKRKKLIAKLKEDSLKNKCPQCNAPCDIVEDEFEPRYIYAGEKLAEDGSFKCEHCRKRSQIWWPDSWWKERLNLRRRIAQHTAIVRASYPLLWWMKKWIKANQDDVKEDIAEFKLYRDKIIENIHNELGVAGYELWAEEEENDENNGD